MLVRGRCTMFIPKRSVTQGFLSTQGADGEIINDVEHLDQSSPFCHDTRESIF